MTTTTAAAMRVLSAVLLLLLLSSVTADHKTRMDFVRAMDKATRQKNNLVDFQRRLLANARPVPPRVLANDDDAANDDAANDDTANDDAANDDGGQYVNDDGLDLRDYALKYVGCQSINTWSDNMAQDEDADTVFSLNRFVVFRLCPADSCSNYNKFGCQYDYGEYMVLMDDYLNLMAQYHYERYAEYCATCSDCMTNGGRRRLDDGDDAVGDDNAANDDAAGDDAVADDDAAAGDDGAVQCQYEDACSGYEDTCKDYNGDDAAFQDYFECAEFELGNNVAYLGPHCHSDGKTITIGIYNDEYCTEYVEDLSNMAADAGLDYTEDSLSFYSSQSCISCDIADQWDLYGNDADGIYDLCEELYDGSAKCNRYMYESDTYESENQEENEEEVCGFIESLVMNTYDENGEIDLASMYFDFHNWMSITEYTKVVSPAQIFGLVVSILLVFGLLIYAAILHWKLTRRSAISRTTVNSNPDALLAGKISRIHSGIMMNRSRSGGAMA